MLIALMILLLLILLVITYLLYAPLVLEIDSNAGYVQVRFHRLARLEISSDLNAVIQIGWWRKKIHWLDVFLKSSTKATAKGATENEESQPSGDFEWRWKLPWQKAKAILRSFKVRECYITFDTGDMPLNGQLYPVCYMWSAATGYEIIINFWDENTVVVSIENNLARLLWTYLRN